MTLTAEQLVTALAEQGIAIEGVVSDQCGDVVKCMCGLDIRVVPWSAISPRHLQEMDEAKQVKDTECKGHKDARCKCQSCEIMRARNRMPGGPYWLFRQDPENPFAGGSMGSFGGFNEEGEIDRLVKVIRDWEDHQKLIEKQYLEGCPFPNGFDVVKYCQNHPKMARIYAPLAYQRHLEKLKVS